MYKSLEKKTFFAYFIYLFLIVLLAIKLYSTKLFISDYSHSFLLGNVLKFQKLTTVGVLILKSIVIFLIIVVQYAIFKSLSFISKSSLVHQLIFLINLIISLCLPYEFVDLLMALFVSMIFVLLFPTFKQNRTMVEFFNIGLLYSFSLLISFKFLLFIPAIFICINIFGKSGFKDFWAFLLGFLGVAYLFFSMLYLTDSIYLIASYLKTINSFKLSFIDLKSGIFLIIAFLLSVSAFPKVGTYNINTRKIYTIITILCFTLIPYSVFFQSNQTRPFISLFLLSSFCMSSFITGVKNDKKKNLLFIIGLVLAILATFFL